MSMLKAGVIGDPIAQSLSPVIHGHWIRLTGLNADYQAIHIRPDELGDRLKRLADEGYRGVNVTVPHKESVFALCDDLTATAKAIGAVNVLTFKDGRYVGDNSDAYGFWTHLEDSVAAAGGSMPKQDQPVFLLGAGGASRAVIYAFKSAGYNNIWIANRSREKAEALVESFGVGQVVSWEDRLQHCAKARLVVNSTSLGMTGQPALFDGPNAPEFNAEQVVYDLVYKPLITPLLAAANRVNPALAVDGLGMLLNQAVPSFDAFFGERPTIDDDLKQLVLDRIQ